MTAALVSTAAMSIGAIAATLRLHPLVPFAAFAVALAVLVVGAVRRRVEAPWDRFARPLVVIAVLAALLDRHVNVASSAVAPDDVLAVLVVIAAFTLPAQRRWLALGAGLVLATYVMSAAILIATSPYHSDAVVAAHGGAELVLAGREPYADFDMIDQLARFGLRPEYATPLEDGTRLRALQYPALAVLVPAPLIAAGLADVRVLYLVEVLAIFGLAMASVALRWRAVVLAVCVGNVVVLDQFVLAGVDPLWALLVLVAWVWRRHLWSAVPLGLAIATRQPAWLVAPFVIAWTWRRAGPGRALVRAAIALGIALLVHAPYLASAPGLLLASVTAPALLPLEPWGVGPAKLLADTVGPIVPRVLFVVAAGVAYVAALWAVATSGLRLNAPVVLPLLPLWLSWRALQSYFAFLPLFATLGDDADR